MTEPREPRPPEARQTDVTQTSHSHHDLTIVAALAAEDLVGPDLTEARALVAGCPACAELHDDLRAIALATRDLPAPIRTRDFRLTEEQAGRLRPGGWRRLIAGFGAPSLRLARPVGVAMATIGLAGLLLSAAPAPMQTFLAPTGGQVGGAASERDLSSGESATAAPEVDTSGGEPPEIVEPASSPAPVAPEVPGPSPVPAANDGGADFQGAGDGRTATEDDGSAPDLPWLPIASVALLGGGVGLVLLRRAGERA